MKSTRLKVGGFNFIYGNKGGKDSHRNYEHVTGRKITLSGKLGDDAKKYQEREVKLKIAESKNETKC